MEQPKYFVLIKEFSSGDMKRIDVLEDVFEDLTIDNYNIYFKIPNYNYRTQIFNKEDLKAHLKSRFVRQYWSRCEYEFVTIDWPYTTIEKSNPIKIDVFYQLELNIPIITELVWNYINFIKNNEKLRKAYSKRN